MLQILEFGNDLKICIAKINGICLILHPGVDLYSLPKLFMLAVGARGYRKIFGNLFLSARDKILFLLISFCSSCSRCRKRGYVSRFRQVLACRIRQISKILFNAAQFFVVGFRYENT